MQEDTIQGLTSQKVKDLQKQYGFNEIPQKKDTIATKIIHKLLSPISGMLLTAAILSLFLGKTFDFYFILLLLVINIAIALWQENKADSAIKKLNENLAQKVKTKRNDKWEEVDSRFLVPGDIIELTTGEIIPADGIIIKAQHISINESALTGESLPKDKKEKDKVFSGSFMVTGIATIQVNATGKNTSFGKTIYSVETLRKKSLLEKDILSISKFLTILSILAIIILTIVFLLQKVSILELLTLDLSLLIAGIPISLPTVMTLIIEFGVIALAGKNAIVRRLSSLEDLANVNFLLTDKTGTLTKNKIEVQDIYTYDKFTHDEAISWASIIASQTDHDLIDIAIAEKAKEMHIVQKEFKTLDYIPADSSRKRATISISYQNKDQIISLGAPQIILSLCHVSKPTKEKFDREVETLAKNGYRALALCVKHESKEEKGMQLVGLFALSDTLRDDAKSVIQFLKESSIGVSMVTGDNRAIAAQISRELELNNGIVLTKEELEKNKWNLSKNSFKETGAFAEILPEDKLHLVQKAKEFFVVASNGDGVNDLPAIKAANVGIAVKNAVSALKATADIVLLTNGISVIRDAIIESRKIFARLYTYSLYRISESLRMIVTIAFLGIAYREYPLTALQIIVIALLNDIPIITLASDNVRITNRPSKIDAKKRFTLSSSYGIVGILTSLVMFFVITNMLHFHWATVQTMFFLKLTVSGHMLIYVVHTKERWWKFLPSKQVILATGITQIIATILAITGFLMPGKINLLQVLFVWGWAFAWMQVAELVKFVEMKLSHSEGV